MTLLLSLPGLDFSSYYSLVISAGVGAIWLGSETLFGSPTTPFLIGPVISALLVLVGLVSVLLGVRGLRRSQRIKERYLKYKIKTEKEKREAEAERKEFYQKLNDTVKSNTQPESINRRPLD